LTPARARPSESRQQPSAASSQDPTTPQDVSAASGSSGGGSSAAAQAVASDGAPAADATTTACVKEAYGAVGAPEAVGSDVAERVICRAGYALAFDLRTRDPDWVIEHVAATQIVGSASRSNAFKADPILGAAGSQLADYARSGYDRGHQAPAGDFKSSQALMDDSFYLSNMAPQVGLGFNRGEWARVEGSVRCWLKQGVAQDVYIITGPVYGSGTKTIGANKVVVPTSFFKIVYDPKRERAIGFELPNQKLANQTAANFVTPISQIEQDAGLTFLPAVTADLYKEDKPVMWSNVDKCAGGDGGA
jgi:endonuclease G